MAALFLFSVLLQYNDPDPIQWMAIYGLAAVACILCIRGKLRWYMSAAVGIAALIWAGGILPDVLGKPTDWPHVFGMMHMISPTVEETREIGGLLIVAIWMFVLTFAARPRKV
jgi:hypothetical protein